MIGLDTNVVVRYLLADDAVQYARAQELFDSFGDTDPGFISLVTLVETSWVLTRGYDVPRAQMGVAIKGFLASHQVVVERSDLVRRALTKMDEGADFADAIIAEVGAEAGCRETVTFERRASQRAGMRLLE